MLHVEATLKNQHLFTSQFAERAGGQINKCMNTHSVFLSNEAGLGDIKYIKHSYFNFIISNVQFKEKFLFSTPEKVKKSAFVDFGLFSNGQIESSFLEEHKQFGINVPAGKFQHFTMLIPKQFIPSNYSLKDLLSSYDRFVKTFSLQHEANEIINSDPKNIIHTIANESKALNLVSSWLQFLSKKLDDQELECILNDYDKKCINEAKIIIDECYVNPPTIELIARRVGINSHKLKCGFKKLFNTSIRQYAIYLKMEKAKELLMRSDLSIAAVSNMVGYSQQGYFAIIFRRFYGQSPRKFQKYHQMLR